MKKYLLTLIVCFIGNSNAFSQNAYYDAIYCASLRTSDFDIDGTITLSKGDNTILGEMREFHYDPFTKKRPDFNRVRTIFRKIKSIQTDAQDKSAIAGLEVLGLLAPIFNLSKMSSAQTDTLLYGLTVYLAEEFRKGYMHTYMNGVKNTIGKSGELQVLFPMTYQKILTFDPIRYKDFGNEMKAVFDDDLGSSLENLMKHIEVPDTKLTYDLLTTDYCKSLRDKEIYPYLGLTASMGQKLINGVHPSDVLGFLDEKYYKSTIPNEEKIGETIHLLNILQRNLRDTATRQSNQFSNVWLNFEKLSKLNDTTITKFFLALIQQEDADFFSKTSPIKITKGSLNNYITTFNTLKKEKITPLLSILTKLDELTKLKDKNLLEEKNFEIYLKNVGELVALVETATNTLKSPKLKNVVAITSNVFQLYNAVRVKNYSNLPVYLGNILSNLSKEEPTKLNNIIASIDKFSGFSSGIVSAKTSADVSKVISNFAAPPASFISKR
jgi:hypothetical protein